MIEYSVIYQKIKERKYDDDETGFRNDLRLHYELKDNPKFDSLYTKAWERGHSSGYHEMLHVFDDLVELIR